MELNHGGDDGKPYPLRQGRGRQQRLRRHLRGVPARGVGRHDLRHRDLRAATRRTAPRSRTWPSKLNDMLRSRRQNGNLSREEFSFVAAMSWFHLTLETRTLRRSSGRCAPTPPAPSSACSRSPSASACRRTGCRSTSSRSPIRCRGILIQIEIGDYNDARSRAGAVHAGDRPADSPEDGDAPDHHALDRDHRPRRQGAQGRGELARPRVGGHEFVDIDIHEPTAPASDVLGQPA